MRAIPPNLEPAVLAKAGEGLSTRQIAEWLSSEHAVRASHVAVASLLKATKAERADAAGAIARKALSTHVLSDLDVLARERIRLQKLARRLYHSDPDLYLKAVDRLVKVVESKLHFAGVDSERADVTKLSDEELQAKLAEAYHTLVKR